VVNIAEKKKNIISHITVVKWLRPRQLGEYQPCWSLEEIMTSTQPTVSDLYPQKMCFFWYII